MSLAIVSVAPSIGLYNAIYACTQTLGLGASNAHYCTCMLNGSAGSPSAFTSAHCGKILAAVIRTTAGRCPSTIDTRKRTLPLFVSTTAKWEVP